MSPDQIQQMMNQQMQMAASATPLWMKALFLLQVLSLLVTVICLPLITWKMFFSNKPNDRTGQSFADDTRLREIRERREALEKLTSNPQDSSVPQDNDSRYLPPQ